MHRSALREGQKTKPSKECNSHARNNEQSLVFTWSACCHTRRSGFSSQSRTNPARLSVEARMRRLGRHRQRGPEGERTRPKTRIPATQQLSHERGRKNLGHHRG